MDLAAKVYQKHTDLAAASPLNAMVSHKWADNGPIVAPCLQLHKQAEEAYRQRDLMLNDITESVKASRDLLLGVYRETPKALGEYGFEVDDTVRVAKKKP